MNAPETVPNPPLGWEPRSRLALRAAAVLAARVRFLLLAGALLGLIAFWPLLQNTWAKLTRPTPPGRAVSSDTEYWCPMCPGVSSEWPSKCPVCNMALVRRQKGDMTPLPDGVVARVQLSPYRIQLAGVRTAPVDYVRLEYEVTVAGFLEAASDSGATALVLTGDVFERDAAMLAVGEAGAVSCDTSPGETVSGRVTSLAPAPITGAGRRVRVEVQNTHGELRPGVYATARFRSPVARGDAARRLELEQWRDSIAVGLALGAPDGTATALLGAGLRRAVGREGYVLAVPESAVIDTGARQVVYRESMPGTFDAVEVRLGRRCGDFYPVRSGLGAGERVATAGAVLLDAETRLNPSVAASYFGAGPRPSAAPPPAPLAPGSPGTDDPQLIAWQKICPVTGQPLDSMGGPVRLVVDGRVVFICCEGCEKPLRDPKKKGPYLQKLPK